LLQVRIDRGDGRTRVTVSGEIDHDTAPPLKAALTRALGDRGDLLEVDLAAVHFCDCSGLSVLLYIRACAEDCGVTLTLTRAGSAVLRLLALTETRALFTLTDPVPVPLADPPGGPVPD
jgi:anti-anti-sigma factor